MLMSVQDQWYWRVGTAFCVIAIIILVAGLVFERRLWGNIEIRRGVPVDVEELRERYRHPMDGKQANLGIRSEFDYLPMTNREDS